jgi:hypothetical protein
MIAAARSRLTYSNLIATMALFIALGGVAVAATQLPRNSVGARQLKRGAVTSAKLAKKSVTNGKLAANSVGPGNIGNGAVTSAKLAANSVIASTIKNSVITTNKLNTEAVTTPKLGNESVTSAKLGKGSVTAAKLSDEIGPLTGTLKSGQTLRGVFDIGSGNSEVRGASSFQFPLLNPPAAPNTNVLKTGQTTTACPGLGGGATPQAAPGQLCVYITSESGLFEVNFDGVNRLGFGLVAFFTSEALDNAVSGQWAVTAP